MSTLTLAKRNAAPATSAHQAGAALRGGLLIGEPNDAYEQEADRVANEISGGGFLHHHWSPSGFRGGSSFLQRCSCGQTEVIEGECEECKKKKTLQRKAGGPAHSAIAPPIVHDVLRSSGEPLDSATRSYFEARVGRDLSGVRVHADAKAAESARSVNAHAYTVGGHVVFAAGRYQPSGSAGRRLLAHELVHTVQQTGRAAGRTLQRQENKFADLSIPELRKLLRTDPEAAEALRLRYRAMSPGKLKAYTASDAIAQSEYARKTIAPAEAEGTGSLSNREAAEILEQELQRQRSTSGIPRRTSSAVTPGIKTEGGTLGTAKTDIPGLEDQVFTGRSPLAGGGVNPGSKFSPATDPAVLPQTHGHAEQHIADQLEEALKAIPREQLKGRRVWMLIEQEPCSTCAQGLTNPAEAAGVLRKLSQEFPELTFEIKSLTSNSLFVLRGGARINVGAAGAASQSAAAGEAAAAASAQVGTKIEVTNSVKQANGSTISEVEYSFGENLKQVNKGAPAGAELPSRIAVRVTQDADGIITSVESLSGQPQALVEALANRTLTPAVAKGVGGAAEGAATGAGRSALLFKGLKIGGWAAFGVITAYQLYKATPRERPRVLVKAGGGLAGGIGATALVCNALLDIETAGWGLVICGFIAGGVGGYAGSEAAGAAYDDYEEATASELDRAFHALSTRSANERVVFNILVNQMGYTANCIDAAFVNKFMSTMPARLQDSEAVLLAAALANASIAPPPPARSRTPAPAKKKKGTVCPSCHGRSQSDLQPTLPDFDQETFDAIMAAPSCNSNVATALAALNAGVRRLPRYQRAPGDVSHHPEPGAAVIPANSSRDPNAFPTVEEQMGENACPGGACHGRTDDRRRATRPATFPGQSTRLTDADQRAIADWLQSEKRTPASGNTHGTRADTRSAPAGGFPLIEQQRSAPCPNCHAPSATEGGIQSFGGLGTGPGGRLTDVDRRKLIEFITAQTK